MSAEDRDHRIAQLERRIGTLEALVRELSVRAGLPAVAAEVSPRPSRPAPTTAAAPPPASEPTPRPRPRIPPITERPASGWDLEQWFGAKALLLVGVVALLAAAGFFLNYAFERGWIPPLARAVGAVLAGIAVAGLGERQVAAGLRRFGLGLIGAGAGLVYLGIWAAAGPYALIGRRGGILLFAIISSVLAQRAADHRAEALALWALLGAFLAPVLLPVPETRPDLLLAYLVVIGHAAGALSVRRKWRGTLDVALLGYFALAVALVPDALTTPAGLGYVTLGGLAALVAWRKTGWEEVRLAGFLLGWLLLMVDGARSTGPEWVALALGSVWLVAEWGHGLSVVELGDPELRSPATLDAGTFFAAPVAWAIVTRAVAPAALEPWRGLIAAAAATLFLAGGWPGRRAAFVAVGFGLLAFAAATQLDRPEAVIGAWCVLILAAQAADRWMAQRAGAAVALLLSGVTGLVLFSFALPLRAELDPAFSGAWALALYAYLGATAAVALSWHARPESPEWLRQGRTVMWSLVGLAIFAGGSLEIHRFFSARVDAWPAARLAGDLAISVFWLAYAGATVGLGFRFNHGAVRGTGLAVAGLAAAKIALYDLGRLEALFRVGSFFVLALMALAVAYVYNRKGRSAASIANQSAPH